MPRFLARFLLSSRSRVSGASRLFHDRLTLVLALSLLPACGGGGGAESAPSSGVGAIAPTATTAAVASSSTTASADSGATRVAAAQIQPDPGYARLSDAWDSLSLPHEIAPKGLPETSAWRHAAKINMGTEPYAESIPDWWVPGIRYPEWRSMSSWFVIYPDDLAVATQNTAVEVQGMEMWVLLKSTGGWKQLQAASMPSWQGHYRLSGAGRVSEADYVDSPDGSRIYRPGLDFMVHGGLGQVATPWVGQGADIQAIYLSIRHRLALRDPHGVDDRNLARFGVAVGVDYLPWLGASLADLQADYIPSAGVGQFQRSEDAWRVASILIPAPGMKPTRLFRARPPSFSY